VNHDYNEFNDSVNDFGNFLDKVQESDKKEAKSKVVEPSPVKNNGRVSELK